MEECLPKMPFAQILLTYSAMMDALVERFRKEVWQIYVQRERKYKSNIIVGECLPVSQGQWLGASPGSLAPSTQARCLGDSVNRGCSAERPTSRCQAFQFGNGNRS